MTPDRLVSSLSKALDVVNVQVINHIHNRHTRVKICARRTQKFGNITLSASPSDFNVQRQRERQIRKELQRLGVENYDKFCWRTV